MSRMQLIRCGARMSQLSPIINTSILVAVWHWLPSERSIVAAVPSGEEIHCSCQWRG